MISEERPSQNDEQEATPTLSARVDPEASENAEPGPSDAGSPTDDTVERLVDAAVSDARAERVDARDSVIGVAQADGIDVRDGLVGIAGAERIEVGQSFVGVAGAGELRIQDSTVLLAGGPMEGENNRVLFTPQQAAFAGAAFGLAFAIARWIFSGEKG